MASNEGCLSVEYSATASVNDVVLVSGRCRLLGVNYSTPAVTRFIRFYDMDSAPPAQLSVRSYIRMRIRAINQSREYAPEGGILMENGIAIRITQNTSDTDNTAVNADDALLVVFYRLD